MFWLALGIDIFLITANMVVGIFDVVLFCEWACDELKFEYRRVGAWVTLTFFILMNVSLMFADFLVPQYTWPILRPYFGG
ncbi:hypothetical protein [Bifidobacterium apri]|uniref:Uncharacterized protein n=1 Tax=Bifidobacterium apri TaxID=1769423 RepID=A0A6A2WBW5_9BIFI|nr:hypothetical protein [Bifidobacterium apri]KAB8292072.1 hypothetical protein DSM100238_1816 [Bifidobacterium apri]